MATKTNTNAKVTTLIDLYAALDAANLAAHTAARSARWPDDTDALTDETLRLITDTTFRFKEIVRQMAATASEAAFRSEGK